MILFSSRSEGEEMEYRSVDTVLQRYYSVKFLNTLNPTDFKTHKLLVKVGTSIMLSNFHLSNLYNGTVLYVKGLQKNVIKATVIIDFARGELMFIPRIQFLPSDYPFEFKILQFLFKVYFNK